MNGFIYFLKKKGMSQHSAGIHQSNVQYFLNWLEKQNIPVQDCDRSGLTSYLLDRRNKGWQSTTLRLHLKSITYYFDYLNIAPNPALSVRLEKRVKTIPTSLWTVQNLIKLYENHSEKHLRNKVVLGFVCFQALRQKEMQLLEKQHIDLENNQIYIAQSSRHNARYLPIKEVQLPALKSYLNSTTNSNVFAENHVKYALSNLLTHLKKAHPELGLHRIRASVYAHWLENNDLRKVQYLAGHRYVSSTERYELNYLEALQEELEQFHPNS